MRILITGCEGVIGTPLHKALEQVGHDVYGCDTKHSHLPRVKRCNIQQHRQVEETFAWAKPDLIVHLAAEFGRWNGEDHYEDLWLTNVVGTKNILDCGRHYHAKLMFASSSEVYGDTPLTMYDNPIEYTYCEQLNDYAITKQVNEQQLRNARSMYGLESMVFRLFNTYGPGEPYNEYRSVVSRFCHAAVMDHPYVVHRGHTRTHTYIHDAIDMLVCLVDNFTDGEVYNVSGNTSTTIEELAEIIGGKYDVVDPEPHTTIDKNVDNSKIMKLVMGPDNLYKGAGSAWAETPLTDGIEATKAWMEQTYGGV